MIYSQIRFSFPEEVNLPGLNTLKLRKFSESRPLRQGFLNEIKHFDLDICKENWIKSILWEYSNDEEYLEEFNKGKNLIILLIISCTPTKQA